MTYKVQVIAVTTLLLWQILLSYGQSEPVKMTFLGIKPFESESTETLYQCHISESDNIARNAHVESFRTVRTRNDDDENIDPPAPVWHTSGSYKHWRVTLDNDGNNNAFGVFGCEAALDGKINTSISGISMRSDADIVPSDELVSLTVNAGDTGVSIGMKSTGLKNVADFRWLKDNARNGGFNGDDTWVISGPVEVDDAGVYECHIQGERSGAKQGLKLLIVRACPPHRWGPDTCDSICDNCYNGGICDENSGKCICAPGFQGTNCESECGGNRYGDTCERRCSSSGDAGSCSSYLFCLAHPYGCSCNTGWKGLDCLIACDSGTYGASCLQTCHCQSGQCDRYTGVCTGSSTDCSSGWTGTNCQQQCDQGTFGAGCLETCHCQSGQCDRFTGVCTGSPPGCSSGWTGTNCQECVAGKFGTNCQQTCHCSSGECNIDTGHCTGTPTGCTDGWKGSSCQQQCDQGTFGASCLETCHCQSGQCDRFTGVCTGSGGCSSGWKGTNCQQQCDQGTFGADCLETCHCQSGQCNRYTGVCTGSPPGCSSGWTGTNCQECLGPRFGMDCENDCHCSESYCNKVSGSCSGGCNPEWVELFSPNLCQTGLIDAAYTRKNPGVTVPVTCTAAKGESSSDINQLEFVLSRHHENLDDDGISLGEVTGDAKIRTVAFMVANTTDGQTLYCQLRKDDNKYAVYNITIDLFDLPVLQSAPKKGSITNSTVTISWSAWDEQNEDGDPPVIGYTPYYKLASGLNWSIQDMSTPIKALNFTFTALTPEERYSFSVAAVREGEMGEGSKSPMLNATTICAVPLSGPGEVQAAVAGERQENVEITWQVPSDEQVNCGSGVSAFTIYYSSNEVEPNDDGTKDILDPDATSHIFENLMVGKIYTFQMTLTTAGGESPFSDEVTHLFPILPTLSSAPELGASSCDRVNITWRRWKEGLDVGTPPICGYIPYHKLTANLSWTANEMVPHQGEHLELWFEFENLAEVSNYTFAIAVVREGLEGTGDMGTNLYHETPRCETGPSAGLIAGSTIGAFLLIVLLALLVIYMWRKSKSDKCMNDSQAARTKFGTSSSAFKPDVEPVTVITDADGDDLYINIVKPVPVLVTNLETYMKNCEESKSNTLEQQFQGFNKGKQFASEVGEEDDNRQKNRFKNMIAYDHSRVILEKLEGDPHSDYYNANYIKNAEEFNAFIACQGPNTASIDDFWRMVIQEKVLNIVMLTNLIEKGKERCKQYWPKAEGDTKKFATCEVKWESTENFADYEIRSLTVTFVGNEQRKVRNWHYRTWPDMDVPQQATPLIGFAKKVKLQQSASTGPLVVHCSAGVGRTGTFIALSTLTDAIHNNDRIDIYGFVEKMRENRIMMVQTALQFKFLHTCLLEVYLTGETEITLGNISSFDADEKSQQLDKEFKLLSKLDKMSKTAHKATKEQAQKCRFPTMIPVEKRSPILQCMSKFGSNNFINACFASSFVMKDAFIATQSPLPNTTEDFWRLVYDWKCPLIVMLNQLDPKDESCCQYWPDSGSAEYGYLMVELKVEQDMGFYEYRVFELTHSYDKKNFTIHHLMLKAWNEGSDVLQLMKRIEILEEKYNLEGPKVVHCRNGVGRTGVLLAVKSEMERITVENKLNVFNSVRMLRSSNHSLVLTKEDYILCHQLLKMANPAEPEYANI